VQALTTQIDLGAHCSCSARGFHWETGRRIRDAFSVREKNLEPERACTLCTGGERSKHFIDDMMNLVLLFSELKFLAKKACSLCVHL